MATMTSGLSQGGAVVHRRKLNLIRLETMLIELRALWLAALEQGTMARFSMVEGYTVHQHVQLIRPKPFQLALLAIYQHIEDAFVVDSIVDPVVEELRRAKAMKLWAGRASNDSTNPELAWSELTIDLGVFFLKYTVRAGQSQLVAKF